VVWFTALSLANPSIAFFLGSLLSPDDVSGMHDHQPEITHLQPVCQSADEARLISMLDVFEARWRAGEMPDSQQLLTEEPGFYDFPLLLAELAFSEFEQRRLRGEEIDGEQFCGRFPLTSHPALRKLIEAHDDWTVRNPSPSPAGGGLITKNSSADWPQEGGCWQGYQLLSELGRGGSARVYLALEPGIDERLVVVKITRYPTDEGELQARLVHECLMPALTVRRDVVTGMSGIVMPYWGRATVYDLAQARSCLDQYHSQIPPQLIALIARDKCGREVPIVPHDAVPPEFQSYLDAIQHFATQLVDGLNCMHLQGVLHRDLKPANILLSPNGRPVIIDFQFATLSEQSAIPLGGTIPYMSPEALDAIIPLLEKQEGLIGSDRFTTCASASSSLGRNGYDQPGATRQPLADEQLDLFAIGVILFELLTGRLPFGAPSITEPLLQQVRGMISLQVGQPDPFAADTTDLPEDWKQLIRRCLALGRDQRFSSAAELLVALLAIKKTPPSVGC
jgi:serine/threonine protein kinase